MGGGLMDRDELYRRMLANMTRFYRCMGEGTGGVLERDGVLACLCPPAPTRSFFNAVVYTDGATLRDALDDVAAAYDAAGVRAWTVWVPEEDRQTAAALEAAGSVLDAEPRAMAAPLAEVDVGEGAGAIEWRQAERFEEVAPVAGPAFGVTRETTIATGEGLRDEVRFVVARAGGVDAACVGTLDLDGDCGVYMVATAERVRGRGLATALMRQALLDARDRGLETTSLQATRMGAPIYSRLGYRDLGAIQMWERRR
jgi:ribosomal protein S18 acetylase RimI-like enzyme